MKKLLEYAPQLGGESQDTLTELAIGQDDLIYSGNTAYRYQESYITTRGIKKGLNRFRELGLLPERCANTQDAFLEVASNNLLPGIAGENQTPHYIKFRGGTTISGLTEEPKVDILVSQCLFGVTGNKLNMTDGTSAPMTSPKSEFTSKIEAMDIDNRLSLYELESIYRQAALVHSLINDNSLYTSLTIGLPRVGYYLHALKPYSAGLLSPEITLAWFDAVDKRFINVLGGLRSALGEILPVKVITPLDAVEDELRETVRLHKPMELDSLLAKLSRVDALWNRILKYNSPNGLYQLKGDFSEAVEEARIPTGSNARLVIKSPKEEGTFELSDKLTKDCNLVIPRVAMYALPQVVTRTPGPGLYQMNAELTDTDRDTLDVWYQPTIRRQ